MGRAAAPAWHRLTIARVEDLSDAVLGAGIEATQMSTRGLSGSLVFAEDDGVTYSGGLINGRVALRGPLSPDTLTVGVVLHLDGPCRHWTMPCRVMKQSPGSSPSRPAVRAAASSVQTPR